MTKQEKTNYNEKYEIVLHATHFNARCNGVMALWATPPFNVILPDGQTNIVF